MQGEQKSIAACVKRKHRNMTNWERRAAAAPLTDSLMAPWWGVKVPRGHNTSSKPAGQNLPRAQGRPGPEEPVAGMTTRAGSEINQGQKNPLWIQSSLLWKTHRLSETSQNEKSLFFFACSLYFSRKCVLGHTAPHNLPLKTHTLRPPTHLVAVFCAPKSNSKYVQGTTRNTKLETNRGLNQLLCLQTGSAVRRLKMQSN